MVDKTHTLLWTNRAEQQLKATYDYISKDSIVSARKVIFEIAEAVKKATTNAELYRPDKYKLNNDGTYRAFELHSYRISYRFKDNMIRVLQVRHTSRKPRYY